MSGVRRVRLTELNPHLVCVLCGGYYVDATTIIECLHSFCKTCIVRYLESSKFCPICDVQVHKTKPLLSIRPDKILQDIVYKLVPGLYQNEMCLRREFYKKHADAKPLNREDSGCDSGHWYVLPDDTISVALKAASSIYSGNMKHKNSQPKNFVRYLQCPAGVSIGQLKKLLRAKFGLPANHPVSLLLGLNDHLQDSLTLVDVAYITSWQKTEPLLLFYQIYESASKRIKLDPELYKSMFEVKEEELPVEKLDKVVPEDYKIKEDYNVTPPAIVTVGNAAIGTKSEDAIAAHPVVNADDKGRTASYLGNTAGNTDRAVLGPLCGGTGAVSRDGRNMPAALTINNSSLNVTTTVSVGNAPIGIDNRGLTTALTVGNAAVGIDGRGLPATLAVGNGTMNMNGKIVPESPTSCAAPGAIASPLLMSLAHGTRTPSFSTPTGNGVDGVGSVSYGEPQVAAGNLTPLMMYGGSVGNTIGKAYSETKQGTTSDSLGKVNMLSSSSTEPCGETLGYSQIGNVLGCAGVTVAGAVQLFSQPMPGLTAMNSAGCIMLSGPDSAATQAVADPKGKCSVSGSDSSGSRETSAEGSQGCAMPSLPPVVESVAATPQNKETDCHTNNKDTSEWKEVQLTISECGVMSVCGGETTDFMESLINSPETSELLSKIESGVICDEVVPKDVNKSEGKDSCLPKELSMPKLEKETIGELPVNSNERVESDGSKSCAPPTLAISATSTPVTLSVPEKDAKKETNDSSKTKEREPQAGGKLGTLKKAGEGKQGGGGCCKTQTPAGGNTSGKSHGPSVGSSCTKSHGLSGSNACGKSHGPAGGKGMQNARESHQSHILAPLAAASQANLTKPFMKSGVTKMANSEDATRGKEVTPTASSSRKNARVDEGSKAQLHPPSKKSSQPIGYKTLKTPPKHWNPTISRQHLTPGGSKLLASKNDTPKTNKIFKARNTPQYSSSGPGSAVKANYSCGGEKGGHFGNTEKGNNSGVQKLGVVQLDPRALGSVSIPITVHATVPENTCALPLTLAPALIVEPTTTTTTTTVAATTLSGEAGGVRVQNSAAKESSPPNPASVSAANRVVSIEAQSVVTSAAVGVSEAPSSYGKETSEMVPKVSVNNHRLSSNCVTDAKCLLVQESTSSPTASSSMNTSSMSTSSMSSSMNSSTMSSSIMSSIVSSNITNSSTTTTTTSSTAIISSQPSNTVPSKVMGSEETSATTNCNNTHNKATVTTVSSPVTSCGPSLSPSVPKLIPTNTGVTSVPAQVSKVAVASSQPLASMLRLPVRSVPSTFGLGSSTGTASYPGASCTLSLPYYTTSPSLPYSYQYLYQEGEFNLLAGHQPQSYMRAYSPCIPQSPLTQHEGGRCANLYSDPSSLQQGLIPMMSLISTPQSPKSHAAPSPRPHTPQSPRPHTSQSPRPHGPHSPRPPPPQSPRPPPPQSPKPPPPHSPRPHTPQSPRPHTSQSPRPHTSQSPRPHAPQSPRPHAPQSPRPHAPPSPRPHAPPSPRPHAPQSPRPHAPQSPRPHAPQSPRPHAPQSPRPHAPQSPRPHAPQSPRPHASQSPRPHASQSPRPHASQSPRPHASQSPQPHASQSPKPHASQSPRPHAPQSPRPHASQSPRPHAPHSPKPQAPHSPSPHAVQLTRPITPQSPKTNCSQTPKSALVPSSKLSSHQQQLNKLPLSKSPVLTPHKSLASASPRPPVSTSKSSHQQTNKTPSTVVPKTSSHSLNKAPVAASPKVASTLPPKSCSHSVNKTPSSVSKDISSQTMRAPVHEVSKSGSTLKASLNPQTTNASAPAFSVPHIVPSVVSTNTTSNSSMPVGKDLHPDKKNDTTVELNKSGENKSRETTTAFQQNTQATPPNSSSNSQLIADGNAVSAANSQGSCTTGFSNESQVGRSVGLIPASLACTSDVDASQAHKYVAVSTGEQTPKNVPVSTQASADNNKSEFTPFGQSSKDINTATVPSSPSDKVSSKWCPAQVRTNAASVSSRSSSTSTLAKSQCSGVEGSVGVPQSSACSPVCDVSHVIDAKTCAEPSVSTNNNQRPCLKS